MPRRRRQLYEGAIYHVGSRGNHRESIYLDDADRLVFLAMLEESWRRYEFRFHAYCLMGNHYHLLVETPRANLDAGMRWLNGIYATRFNRRRGIDGHLFQGRYWSRPVTGDAAITAVARYIARNPVEAGLCDRAELWRWSSYPIALGLATRPPHLALDLLMHLFGAEHGIDHARAAFRAQVDREDPARPQLAALLPDLAAARHAGYTLREIAAAVGLHATTVRSRLMAAT